MSRAALVLSALCLLSPTASAQDVVGESPDRAPEEMRQEAPGETPAAPEGSEPAPGEPVIPPPVREAAEPLLRVAVLLLPTGDVEPATTDALTELVIAAVAARGSPQIVGKEELLSLLGRDDASMLECLESPTCLGIAGVELGLAEIVSGTLGQRDGQWIFVLERIDVRTGRTEGRVFRVVEGSLDALIDALSESVEELYVETIRPGRIVLHAAVAGTVELDGAPIGEIRPDEPLRREMVSPGAHDLVLRARGFETWSRLVEVEEGASLVLDAAPTPVAFSLDVPELTWIFGSAALLTLAGGIAFGIASQETVPLEATMREVFSFYEAREREAIAADVLYVVAALSAGAAVVPVVLAATASGPSLEVGLGPGTLSLGGRF